MSFPYNSLSISPALPVPQSSVVVQNPSQDLAARDREIMEFIVNELSRLEYRASATHPLNPFLSERVKWLSSLSQNLNDAEALCNLAKSISLKKLPVFIPLVEKSAELGNFEAIGTLGACYLSGNGVVIDKDKGIKLLRRSGGEGNNASAQWNLGLAYKKGNGVKKDLETATYWWTRAAQEGHREAQFEVGKYYALGNGVEKDLETATYWWTRAAQEGHRGAQFHLGRLYFHGGDGIAKNPQKAKEWLLKAAHQGHPEAQTRVGSLCLSAHPNDRRGAVHWWTMGAQGGNKDAQFNLGLHYKRHDPQMALHYFWLAAQNGHEEQAGIQIKYLADRGNYDAKEMLENLGP